MLNFFLLMNETNETVFYTIILTAWGVTEMIRYAFYALNELDAVPYFLKWLRFVLEFFFDFFRYSTFYILYPLGVVGEMGIIYNSLNYFSTTGDYSISMPNTWNFAFNFTYFLAALLPIYPPGLLFMMNHMRSQRRKQLNKSKSS